MVNQGLLALLKRAYGGELEAQLILGKIYLTGGQTFYPSASIALTWLSRAAGQGSKEAYVLIGSSFPPALLRGFGSRLFAKSCYLAAAEAGVDRAKEWLEQIDSPVVRQSRQPYIVDDKCSVL